MHDSETALMTDAADLAGPLLGGALIGLSAVVLMATVGRIAGISGIVVRLFPPFLDRETAGRWAFVAGLVVAPLAWRLASGGWPDATFEAGPVALLAGSLLVGFGSVWGAGCTSGHGICGLSRLSRRSFAAVGTFMATAVLTVLFTRHLL